MIKNNCSFFKKKNFSGNIIPPINFKKYEHRFIPPVDSNLYAAPPPAPPAGETKTDIFGQQVPKLKQPLLWKLSCKLNQPQMQQVEKYKEKSQQRSQFLQDYQYGKYCKQTTHLR